MMNYKPVKLAIICINKYNVQIKIYKLGTVELIIDKLRNHSKSSP